MGIQLTDAGRTACNELTKLNMLLMFISGDNTAFNERVEERNKTDGVPVNVEYTEYLESKVGEWGVCSVVDIYQWYNRQVLRIAAQHAPDILDEFREGVPLDAKDIRALATGAGAIDVIIEKVLFRDKTVRTHLHKVLGAWEEDEMSVLVEARNCFVHALGSDFEGRVAQALASKKSPWGLPLKVDGGRVVVTVETAMPAVDIGLAQISIMDQQFENRYGLPRASAQPRKISRSY